MEARFTETLLDSLWEHSLCFLESFVLFRGYRFTEFDVSRTSNVPFTAHEQYIYRQMHPETD